MCSCYTWDFEDKDNGKRRLEQRSAHHAAQSLSLPVRFYDSHVSTNIFPSTLACIAERSWSEMPEVRNTLYTERRYRLSCTIRGCSGFSLFEIVGPRHDRVASDAGWVPAARIGRRETKPIEQAETDGNRMRQLVHTLVLVSHVETNGRRRITQAGSPPFNDAMHERDQSEHRRQRGQRLYVYMMMTTRLQKEQFWPKCLWGFIAMG